MVTLSRKFESAIKAICLLAFIFISSSAIADSVVISGGPTNDYESWIARLSDDRIMVAFARNPDWASGDLYVAFSADNGLNWTSPEPIISGSGDQATLSFVQMPSDTLKLFYASDQNGSYKIRSAWSVDGLTWTDEGVVALGWGTSVQYYDPTLVVESDSSLAMNYVVMSQGVYVAHRPYGGQWDTEMTQVASTGYRPRLMKHTNGTYLYAYHARTGGQYEYDVFITTSSDRLNWSTPVQITTNRNSHDPFVCRMYDGHYMVTYAKHAGGAYNLYCRFSLDAIDWGEEFVITEDNANNTQPHIWPEGNDLYLTYAHAVNYPDDHDVYLEVLAYLTGIADNPNLAENYDLDLGCYPNPFNAATTISYTLTEESLVSLEVYDILGRKIANLINCNQPAGEQTVVWNATDQPSGMYFARLRVGLHYEHVKMILLK